VKQKVPNTNFSKSKIEELVRKSFVPAFINLEEECIVLVSEGYLWSHG
jgi:hypothetical protein